MGNVIYFKMQGGWILTCCTFLQLKLNRVSNFKIVSGDAVHQPTWPLLLKIEHMVKLQVLGNNSKTFNNIKNLTWNKEKVYDARRTTTTDAK
jgi:hypothetical protein